MHVRAISVPRHVLLILDIFFVAPSCCHRGAVVVYRRAISILLRPGETLVWRDDVEL